MEHAHHKDTIRLNFEFPLSAYPYLKMVCAKKGISLRSFATDLLLKAIEEAEDEILTQKAKKRLQNQKTEDLISFDEAVGLAGWDDDKV